MKLRLGSFLLPTAAAPAAVIEKGFAGQNPNFYQRALKENARLLVQMEDLGFDFVAFSEHHFHVEGLEVSNNPVLLGSWAAGKTKRLRIGQMGNVLPARNPLLLAEDLAMLDHFSEGRMIAGFARGYQSRHVLTIGQKMNAYWTAASDPDYAEHDRLNRELFLEHYDIIRTAWREPLFSHHGKHWQIPPAGIEWNHPATRAMAPGMVDAQGKLVRIGIAPQTLQDPDTIEVQIPFTTSKTTIEWAAQHGHIPIIHTPIDENMRACLDLYHNAAKAAGRNVAWGRGIGHFRDVIVADTDAEAVAIQEAGLGYTWTRWHDWFGFNETLRYPGEKGAVPNVPAAQRARGFALCGSVDTVARMLEKMLASYDPELLVLWIGSGTAPIDGLLKSNDLLVNKVLPKLGVELTRVTPKLRTEVQAASAA